MVRWIVSIAAALLSLTGSAAAAQNAPPRLPVNVDTGEAVNACVPVADRERPLTDLTLAQRRRIVSCVFTNTARQINGQLPVQVDEITRLDRITVAGPELTYHYTVSRRLAELPPNVRELAERSTRANSCAQDNLRQTLQMGGTYRYHWVDADGREIHIFRIEAC
jgi:hypothetical protein